MPLPPRDKRGRFTKRRKGMSDTLKAALLGGSSLLAGAAACFACYQVGAQHILHQCFAAH